MVILEQVPGSQGFLPIPVTTVRMFLLCPRNSHSSPFFKMPRSSVPVTTVPRPVKEQDRTSGTMYEALDGTWGGGGAMKMSTVLTRDRVN